MAQSAVDLPAWTLDPDDPRAPSEAVWAAMSDAERAAVVAALSGAVPDVGDLIWSERDSSNGNWRRRSESGKKSAGRAKRRSAS